MSIFTKETLELLYENGYHVTAKNDRITFMSPKRDRWVILIIVIVLSMVLIPVSLALPAIGLPILGGLIILVVHRFQSKTGFILHPDRETIMFISKNKVSFATTLNNVEEIKWTSEFVSEYASAFKLTTTEYEYKIFLNVSGHGEMEILKVLGDYENPDDRFMEVYTFISALIKKSKDLSAG